MWFLEQLEGEVGVYNVPYAFDLRGCLDVEALRQALESIVHRHEPLRTTFAMSDKGLYQTIPPPARFDLPLVDLSDLQAEVREADVEKHRQQLAEKPFDLAHDTLLRTSLIRRAEGNHVLLIVIHHIAWDGWSQHVFWRELTGLYDAFKRGELIQLPEMPLAYVDFALWQRTELQGDRLERLDRILAEATRQADPADASHVPTKIITSVPSGSLS